MSKFLFICAISCFITGQVSYALPAALTAQDVTALIQKTDPKNTFSMMATPGVVAEINRIHADPQAQKDMLAALQRMKKYQPIISSQLTSNNMPADLLAIPLVESGYRELPASKTPSSPAGIWQITPATADE